MTFITYLDSSFNLVFIYVIDLVDATARMQAHAYNKTAYTLPICSRTPISLQLHTCKQYLTNFISSTNIELVYIYEAN